MKRASASAFFSPSEHSTVPAYGRGDQAMLCLAAKMACWGVLVKMSILVPCTDAA